MSALSAEQVVWMSAPRDQGAADILQLVGRSQAVSIDKRAVSRALAKYGANPIVGRVAGYVPWWSLLETTGRKSGLPRRNPVGNGLQGDTFWIVSEHGHRAGYVRNIEADPRVRIRVGGRWRTGTAHVLPEDDPRERQRQLSRFNSGLVRVMGTDLLSVRVDLED